MISKVVLRPSILPCKSYIHFSGYCAGSSGKRYAWPESLSSIRMVKALEAD